MALFIEFLSQQWLLVGALLVCIVLLIRYESQKSGAALTPQELVSKINNEQAVIVDLRSAAEFNQGHIVDAIHIPYGSISKQLKELEAYLDKPLVLVCKLGQQAGAGVKLLNAKGFTHVSRLGGGMMEWQRAQLPLVATPTTKPTKNPSGNSKTLTKKH